MLLIVGNVPEEELILQENYKVLIFLKVYCGSDSQQDYVRIDMSLAD